MTGGPGTTFRLLDPWVGWQLEGTPDGLAGLTDQEGLRLGGVQPGPSRQDLLPWFPDPRLTPACRSGWYLLAGVRRGRDRRPRRQLLRLDPCTCDWQPVWLPSCDPDLVGVAISVASAGHLLVVVTAGRVLVWDGDGRHLIVRTRVTGARIAAVTRRGRIVLGGRTADRLRSLEADGSPGRPVRTGVTGRLAGLRLDGDAVWLLAEDADTGQLSIWTGRLGDELRPVERAELAARLPASDLRATWAEGFCLATCDADGDGATGVRCTDWSGQPLDTAPAQPATIRTTGSMTTEWLDSGISRCRWHRVRLDATVPPTGTLAVRVAVAEEGQGEPDGWQEAPVGSTDFLVDLPPGRRLKLRLELRGDGTSTPVVHRIRLDLPRRTSADLLPAAFRQDPAADDFTERFLSLFDASLSDMDRVIERYPALLDPAGAPDGLLTWLGGLLGLGFDAGWSPEARRALLAEAPSLYRRRGTPAAVGRVIEILTGIRPDITELASERAWASPGTRGGLLGAVRLFGRSTARARLGGSAASGSPLGGAPIRPGGDPRADAVAAQAFRFRITVPPGTTPAQERTVTELVRRQAPAHTVGAVRGGGLGLVVGLRSAVGTDTALVPLPASVLSPSGGQPAMESGGRPVRLGRSSVLQPGRHGPRVGILAGYGTAVGVQTLAW